MSSEWISVISRLPSELEIVDVRQVHGSVWEGYRLVNGKWIGFGGKYDEVDMVDAWKPSDPAIVD